MTTRCFLQSLVAVAIVTAAPAWAVEAAPAEKAKIEALIQRVEQLNGAHFVRNGKSYDSKDAAKFLRAKWESKAAECPTAGDFIEKVASVSSTTGQPYLIRFADGREVKCGEYLRELLKKAGE